VSNDQAILATIHQPSSELLFQFDDLLLLARGGKTVYNGPIGKQGETMIKYFESNGAKKIEKGANPRWVSGLVSLTRPVTDLSAVNGQSTSSDALEIKTGPRSGKRARRTRNSPKRSIRSSKSARASPSPRMLTGRASMRPRTGLKRNSCSRGHLPDIGETSGTSRAKSSCTFLRPCSMV
jgi:hypothetical protein